MCQAMIVTLKSTKAGIGCASWRPGEARDEPRRLGPAAVGAPAGGGPIQQRRHGHVSEWRLDRPAVPAHAAPPPSSTSLDASRRTARADRAARTEAGR